MLVRMARGLLYLWRRRTGSARGQGKAGQAMTNREIDARLEQLETEKERDINTLAAFTVIFGSADPTTVAAERRLRETQADQSFYRRLRRMHYRQRLAAIMGRKSTPTPPRGARSGESASAGVQCSKSALPTCPNRSGQASKPCGCACRAETDTQHLAGFESARKIFNPIDK